MIGGVFLLSLLLALCFLLLIVLLQALLIRDVPYVGTPHAAVAAVASEFQRRGARAVLDIGSGDGRVLIACARAGMAVEGWELNPFLVLWSRAAIARLGLSGKARVHWCSMWRRSAAPFYAVFVFGMPPLMIRFGAKL